jgi:hypothetical protein
MTAATVARPQPTGMVFPGYYRPGLELDRSARQMSWHDVIQFTISNATATGRHERDHGGVAAGRDQ